LRVGQVVPEKICHHNIHKAEKKLMKAFFVKLNSKNNQMTGSVLLNFKVKQSADFIIPNYHYLI
jgi:hypothetical protein